MLALEALNCFSLMTRFLHHTPPHPQMDFHLPNTYDLLSFFRGILGAGEFQNAVERKTGVFNAKKQKSCA